MDSETKKADNETVNKLDGNKVDRVGSLLSDVTNLLIKFCGFQDSNKGNKPQPTHAPSQFEAIITLNVAFDDYDTIMAERRITEYVDGKMVTSKEPVKVSIKKTKTWRLSTKKSMEDTPKNHKYVDVFHKTSGDFACFDYVDEAQFLEVNEFPMDFYPWNSVHEYTLLEDGILKVGWKSELVSVEVTEELM